MSFLTAKNEIKISDSSDWKLFDQIEKNLRYAFSAKTIEACDGLDQAYHDLEINGTIVTLHLEHCLGISLFLLDPDKATEKDIRNLRQIKDYFEKQKAEQGGTANSLQRKL
jgi:hypothetical protein